MNNNISHPKIHRRNKEKKSLNDDSSIGNKLKKGNKFKITFISKELIIKEIKNKMK